MTTQEMIAVLRAYENGKKVQLNRRNRDYHWTDCQWGHGKEIWDFSSFDYRVKPKPREFYILQRDGYHVIQQEYASPGSKHKDIIHVREVLE